MRERKLDEKEGGAETKRETRGAEKVQIEGQMKGGDKRELQIPASTSAYFDS